ncbi:MAG: CBS domain-containing protein [Anaerolineales bacterium]
MTDRSVREWMTSDPIIINSRQTLPDAYRLMIGNNIRRLLVVDDGELVGIVTMRDLMQVEPPRNLGLNVIHINDILSNLPVHSFMTPDPKTISPTDSLMEAAKLMLEEKISGLPVMEGDHLVGIITESDIFRAFVALESQSA